jgi:4-amino-4-deoxy-L-arabinose transferase-like glycosyltransferase
MEDRAESASSREAVKASAGAAPPSTKKPGAKKNVLAAGAFFAIFLCVAAATHLPFLELLPHWDEIGWFLPAALDLYHHGRWIPVSTPPSSHPPGLALYLTAVWSVTGYSILATRAAMLTLGAALAFVTFLLAVRLCRNSEGAPALLAVLFLLVSPLYYTQSMMAQLDMPAALLTVTALLLFLDGRLAASAIVCCALVLMKETGILAPVIFGGWLVWEKRYRQSLWFALPAMALAGWLFILWRNTGHWFGNAEFTDYNLTYPLHPFRLAAALARRIYALAVADLQWVGALAIVWGARRGLFPGREWRAAGLLAAANLIMMSVLGGAHLERYLLPSWPVFYIAAARAFCAMSRWRLRASASILTCGLISGLFVFPPYPFPLENNLAMTTFVELHRTAADYLERDYPAATVATAWPLADALQRPQLGYVSRPFPVVPFADFRPSSLQSIDSRHFDVLVLYSREWEPRFNVMRVNWIERLWRRYFNYERAITSEECEQKFGVRPVARWESRGLWIEVLAKPAL